MHNLTAYIPMDRRLALARGAELPDRCIGAALFADVSGFTPLTRAFAEELGAKHGAEALLGVLNPLFEALIGPVHRYGGSVIGFVGDAITCWFDEEEAGSKKQEAGSQNLASCPLPLAAGRAVASALAMQAALGPLAVVRTPGGVAVTLSIKVAVAYGPARRFVVGDPAIQQIDALVGATLARMAEAEHHAEANEIVVSQEVAAQLGGGVLVSEWRGDGQFAVVTGLQEAVAPIPEVPAEVALSEEVARPWILPAVYAQLQEGTELLGDLRPATPLMLRFGGLDYDGDDAVGEKLDAFVRWVQQVVHRYTGNLLQLTIGDKGAFMYAVFGAPVAHEDDAARALRAALTVRQLPAELAATITPLQIGLTRGEVWTGICGAAARHVYNAVSSEVNLAARLMATAQPGQILISGSMAVMPGFDVRHVGDWRYKGFADPLPTYELQSEHLAEARIFSNAMVGRTAELQQLVDFAQPLLAGKLAGAAIIYGEPGIGKSRLSYALRETLGAHVLWLVGQADSILRQAFNPWVYLLRVYFAQSPNVSAVENRHQFETRLARLQAAPLPASLRAELVRTQSFLGALLDLHWSDSLFAQLRDPKLRYDNTLIALRTFILALTYTRPLVVQLEDGHWLDDASRELLAYLTRQTAQYPLLLLITSRYADDGARPSFPVADWPVFQVDVAQLAPETLRTLLIAHLGELDKALFDFLVTRSQGVPFFAQQLAWYLQETGVIESRNGVWHLRTATSEIPDSLQVILIARLDRLSAQVKQAVQTAAVLGHEFDVRLLTQMLRADAAPIVQEAERGQVWSALTEIRYLFKHGLLRDAAYDMQLRARLHALHQLALEAYEQLYAADLTPYYDELAYHAERGGNVEKQREYFRKAGDAAQANYRNAAAIEYYARLLPLLPEPAEQFTVHLDWGKILELVGQTESAVAHYHSALALATTSAQRVRCQQALGHLYSSRADYPTSLAWFEQARSECVASNHQKQLAQTLSAMGRVYSLQGEYTSARRCLEESLALARTLGDKITIAEVLNSLGNMAHSQYDFMAARTFHEESLTLNRALGSKRGMTASLCNLGNIASNLHDYATSWQFYEASLALARETGHQYGVALLLGNMGELELIQGNYPAAQPFLEESLTLSREIGIKGMAALALYNLGQNAYLQGDYVTARTYLEESLALSRANGEKQRIAASLTLLGRIALSQGEVVAARVYLEESLTWARAVGVNWEIANALMGLGLVVLAQAELATAREVMTESLHLWEAATDKQGIASNLIGLAEVVRSGGDPRRAARLAGAVDALLALLKAKLDPAHGLMNPVYASLIAATRDALGEDDFQAAWMAGEKLSLEEAIRLALEENYVRGAGAYPVRRDQSTVAR